MSKAEGDEAGIIDEGVEDELTRINKRICWVFLSGIVFLSLTCIIGNFP